MLHCVKVQSSSLPRIRHRQQSPSQASCRLRHAGMHCSILRSEDLDQCSMLSWSVLEFVPLLMRGEAKHDATPARPITVLASLTLIPLHFSPRLPLFIIAFTLSFLSNQRLYLTLPSPRSLRCSHMTLPHTSWRFSKPYLNYPLHLLNSILRVNTP